MTSEIEQGTRTGIDISSARAARKVAVGLHEDPHVQFQPVEGYVRKPLRPDLVNQALTQVEFERKAKEMFKARYFSLLKRDRPIPKELVDGLREELFADEFKKKGIPLPSKLPPYFTPSVGLEHTLEAELATLLPELDSFSIFDQGVEVKGDPNSKDILVRMAAVQVGPSKALVPEEVIDGKTKRKKVKYKEESVDLGVRAFDFQLSDLMKKGFIPGVKMKQLENITRLGDFRMRIFVTAQFYEENNFSLAQAIQNAGVIFKGEMGWLSCLETMEQIPALLCNETGNGIVVTYDTPGQFRSPFKNPAEVDTDGFLETLQANNFATDAVLHLFGFDKEVIDRKFQETIGHSKEATAQFFKIDELKRRDRGHILLSPVPGHPVFKGEKVKWLLGRGTRVANLPLIRELVGQGFSHPLIQWFIGTASEDVKALHRLVLQNTDLRVLSRFILRLMSTDIPELPVEAISRDSLRIIIPAYDPFIDFDMVVDQTLGRIRKVDIVKNIRRGHYGASFSDRMKGSRRDIYDNFRNRALVIHEAIDILNHLQRILPNGTTEHWRHPAHAKQLDREDVKELLAEVGNDLAAQGRTLNGRERSVAGRGRRSIHVRKGITTPLGSLDGKGIKRNKSERRKLS